MEPVYRSLEGLASGIVTTQGMRRRYYGLDNIPKTGGAVIAINHTSYVDFMPVGLGLRKAGRRGRFLIKSEVMDVGIMRFLVKHTKTVPVDRSAGAEAFVEAAKDLRAGELVVVYPEATISRSFELKEFKTGAVRMAMAAQVPIIPAICWGAQRLWTKTDLGKRQMGRSRIPVDVEFGTPIMVAPGTDPIEATEELHAVMTGLLHRVQDRYPDHEAGAFWQPARLGGSAPTRDEAFAIEDAEARDKAARREAKRRREEQG